MWQAAFISLLIFPVGTILLTIAYELTAKALRRWVF